MIQAVTPEQLSKPAQALADELGLYPHYSGGFIGDAGLFTAYDLETMAQAVIEASRCNP